MSRRLRVALVGAGSVARSAHLPAYQKLASKAQVVAICDRDIEAARSLSRQFGIKDAYDDTSRMLESGSIDVLDVCTPTREHFAVSMMALERGIHTLVEKPMALTVAECDSLISAAQKSGVKLSVVHNLLFDPIFSKLVRRVRAGQIGEVISVNIEIAQPRTGLISRADHWVHGLPGGVLAETGPHPVYMALALQGAPTSVRIMAHSSLRLAWAPLDEFRIVLSNERGVGSILLSHSGFRWISTVEVAGTTGSFEADLMGWSLIHQKVRSTRSWNRQFAENVRGSLTITKGVSVTAMRKYLGLARYGHRVVIEGFLGSVADDLPVPVDPIDGRETVRVMNLLSTELQRQAV